MLSVSTFGEVSLLIPILLNHAIRIIQTAFARLTQVVYTLFPLPGADKDQSAVIVCLRQIRLQGNGPGIVV